MKARLIATCLATAGLIVASSAASQAQNACTSYVGQTVSPAKFDAAVAGLGNIKPKGEFETTAQYEARRNASLSALPKTLIIAKEPEDRKYFEYDADQGVLRIIKYAFWNTTIDIFGAFYSAGLHGKLEFSTSSSNVDVVISRSDKPAGTYVATNGYGAKAEVQKISRVTKAIFDRVKKGPEITTFGIFPAAEKKPYAVGQLRVPVEDAKRLKSEMKIAFVVAPKEPYVVKGRHQPGKVTIQNPVEITEDFTVLVADLQCGILMDGTGKVLGAYPTL